MSRLNDRNILNLYRSERLFVLAQFDDKQPVLSLFFVKIGFMTKLRNESSAEVNKLILVIALIRNVAIYYWLFILRNSIINTCFATYFEGKVDFIHCRSLLFHKPCFVLRWWLFSILLWFWVLEQLLEIVSYILIFLFSPIFWVMFTKFNFHFNENMCTEGFTKFLYIYTQC